MTTLVIATVAVYALALIVLVVALPRRPRRAPSPTTAVTALTPTTPVAPTASRPSTTRPTLRHVVVLDGIIDEVSCKRLQHELGDDFTVGATAPGTGDIVIADDRDLDRIASLHAVDTTVLVAVHENAGEPVDRRVIRALDHGADACLVHPDTPELAAHVRALHRRHPAMITTGR